MPKALPDSQHDLCNPERQSVGWDMQRTFLYFQNNVDFEQFDRHVYREFLGRGWQSRVYTMVRGTDSEIQSDTEVLGSVANAGYLRGSLGMTVPICKRHSGDLAWGWGGLKSSQSIIFVMIFIMILYFTCTLIQLCVWSHAALQKLPLIPVFFFF